MTRNAYMLGSDEHLVRPRINTLLAQAIQKPLTIVCGGMGCGKTRAVYDFTQRCDFPVMWLQFPDTDTSASHFWQLFVHAVAKTNEPLAKELQKLGFPDTADKLNIFFDLRNHMQPNVRRLYVIDDFHLAKNAAMLSFLEQVIVKMQDRLSSTSIILISREFPSINVSSLLVRNKVSLINEPELNFTPNELHQFLLQQGLSSEITSLDKIYRDTTGWVFIINFVAQILKKTPGYTGYARGAIKQDIAQLIEAEAWAMMSDKLKRLFLRLSLTAHRSMELVNLLAGRDAELISELNQQNVFVHYDRLINAYRIHHLFLDFLQSKQVLLSEDEIRDARKTIADWCVRNDFIVDALFEYEKIGDYEAIISLLFIAPIKFFQDHAQQIVEIFHHAPAEIFDRVEFSAAAHIQLVVCSAQWREALDLIRLYEAKYLPLPEDDAFRNRMLGCIYYYWAILRVVLCNEDHRYDFDTYFAKQYTYLKDLPVHPKCWYQHHPGIWTCFMSSSQAGAPREYLEAIIRSSEYQQKCANGLTAGIGELCQSELLFYQGDMLGAESYAIKAIEKAREYRQNEIVARSLFLLMRIAVFQGDYQKLELSLKDVETALPCHEYSVGFLTYDIVLGWFYYILGQAEKMPDWLKGEFTLPPQAPFYENFGNYIKARYHCLTNNYNYILAYLKKKKQRKSALFERIELLMAEAWLHVKMNDQETALAALQEAYQLAQPNGIVTPFIELGKDMRTLLGLAAKRPDCAIPRSWLQSVRQKASAYSRGQARIISEYNKIHGIHSKITLSPRETIILHDLRDGLSRSEIAARRTLSVNTVKLHINSVYRKLGAHSRADVFRIVAENNIV